MNKEEYKKEIALFNNSLYKEFIKKINFLPSNDRKDDGFIKYVECHFVITHSDYKSLCKKYVNENSKDWIKITYHTYKGIYGENHILIRHFYDYVENRNIIIKILKWISYKLKIIF